MIPLRQNTAVNVKIGPFVDATDFITAETGLTISQSDVVLSKNYSSFNQKNESTACTHSSSGYYICPLDATDTNTVGHLVLAVFEAGAMPVREDYYVFTEEVYDAYYASDAYGQPGGRYGI